MKKLLGILGTITIAGSGMAGLVGNASAPAKNEINYQKADNLENLNRNKRENYNKPIIIDSYQLKDSGVWFETYWYWFGYCRLHFSHNEIESLIEGGHSITELAQQIAEAFPPLAPVAVIIAGWVTLNLWGLNSYDYGNGAWVAFHLLQPEIPLGFGSN
ncbi:MULTISPECIES: hypothetical protein [unclassified Spiroplasma]|uniref:hypothetical protein n=1 Tax=unclassified Spiroplasma TaxID=2637901 RepID=UPI00313B7A42